MKVFGGVFWGKNNTWVDVIIKAPTYLVGTF